MDFWRILKIKYNENSQRQQHRTTQQPVWKHDNDIRDGNEITSYFRLGEGYMNPAASNLPVMERRRRIETLPETGHPHQGHKLILDVQQQLYFLAVAIGSKQLPEPRLGAALLLEIGHVEHLRRRIDRHHLTQVEPVVGGVVSDALHELARFLGDVGGRGERNL